MERPTEATADAVLTLGKLALQFGRVDRITKHEDGVTAESDTDHTVMTSLLACSFAAKYMPELDLGKIAQFALVHDLVEAYAGDTPTFGGITEEQIRDKEKREHDALLRIKKELDHELPWISEMIEAYERLDTPEARYVKSIDKIMPKITHSLNGAIVARSLGNTVQDVETYSKEQQRKMKETYAYDMDMVMVLWDRLLDKLLGRIQ
jgi:putative hydrolase of HD superfamily